MATCFHFRSRFRFRFRFRSRSCFRFRFRFCSRFQKTSHVPRNSKRPNTSPGMPQVPTHIHIHTHTQHTDTHNIQIHGTLRPLGKVRIAILTPLRPLGKVSIAILTPSRRLGAREGENREAQRGVRCTVWVVGWAPARPFQRMSCLQSSKAPLSEGLGTQRCQQREVLGAMATAAAQWPARRLGRAAMGCVPWEGVAVVLGLPAGG